MGVWTSNNHSLSQRLCVYFSWGYSQTNGQINIQLHNFMQCFGPVGPSSGIKCWTLCIKQTLLGPMGLKCCIKLWSCMHSKIHLTSHSRILSYNVLIKSCRRSRYSQVTCLVLNRVCLSETFLHSYSCPQGVIVTTNKLGRNYATPHRMGDQDLLPLLATSGKSFQRLCPNLSSRPTANCS